MAAIFCVWRLRIRLPQSRLKKIRGSVIVFPSNGDVPQLAVAREHRRRGIGRELLDAAFAAAGRPLRILNIDDRDEGIAAFLDACGARRFVRQADLSARKPVALSDSALTRATELFEQRSPGTGAFTQELNFFW